MVQLEHFEDPTPELARAIARAFTLLFQLLNLAEQKEIVRVNRERGERGETIAEAAAHLGPRLAEAAARVEVVPTLTAHPTEAKRKAILDKLQAVAFALDAFDRPPALDGRMDESARKEADLDELLLELWLTDELREQRLTVEEEVRNALYFFDRTILTVVPWLMEDLRAVGAEEARIRYRSWVGGDRDGNPNVTAEVSRWTLEQHRELALHRIADDLATLRRALTVSDTLAPLSRETAQALAAHDARLAPRAQERYAHEPFVRFLLVCEDRLARTGDGGKERYATPTELLTDLDLVATGLKECGAEAVAHIRLDELRDRVSAFGFHLAALDVRQHSDVHERVIGDLLTRAGVLAEGEYASAEEVGKLAVLHAELANPRPLLPVGAIPDGELAEALATLRTIAWSHSNLGPDSVRAYVVSMSHGVSDLLEVLLLAKEAGLLSGGA
ncbi:MAG: phosphoenolpyruvate carboxylase, partial [Armatimonadota bacterium]